MKVQQTCIATAVAIALGSLYPPAQAQEAGTAAKTVPGAGGTGSEQSASQQLGSTQLEEVVVTGIRFSLEQSLNAKRDADSVVEVVSAEDIGKLPDKNIADAVQRLPGVNITKAGAGEGGFSENDRVALRGTSPSLTETLINGHTISTGDWFVQDQGGAGSTVGRSVSYALLPSEITDKITVYKSSQADVVEGGVAGVVDIQTRRPLGFKKPFTAEVSAQAFYNDLPNKSDPQFNALANWKNESGTFGAMLQGFTETRHERRDGQEFLGYATVPASLTSDPMLQNAFYPKNINESLLQHRRYRRGGVVDLEWQPTDQLSLNFDGLYSHMHTPSYDTSFLANPGGGANGYIPSGILPTSYTLSSKPVVDLNGQSHYILTSASFPDATGTGVNPGLSDKIYRPFAFSETYYLDLDAKYKLTSNTTLSAMGGHSRGIGSTPGDMGYESGWSVGGFNYAMNGVTALTSVSWPAPGQTTGNGAYVNNYSLANGINTLGPWFGVQSAVDQENYGQLDLETAVNNGIWQSMKFGVRYSDHTRDVNAPGQGTFAAGASGPFCPGGGFCDPTVLPAWSGQLYPANYQNGLSPPPGYVRSFWQIDPKEVYKWETTYNAPAYTSPNWQSEFSVQEKTSAAYAMANIGGSGWHGNFGVRVVHTKDREVNYNAAAPGQVCAPTPYASFPSAGGCDATGLVNYYTQSVYNTSYNDVLPSTSWKFDLAHDLIGRLAVAKTISRPDWSAMSPTPQNDDLALISTEGSATLQPVRSTNFDAELEWYFMPKSLLSVGLFYLDLRSYVEFKTKQQYLTNSTFHRTDLYTVSYPVNIPGRDKGLEVSYQQPLFWGFGTYMNFTLADGSTSDGQDLVGNSKFTGNAELYWENKALSVRTVYSYRSTYLQGLTSAVPEHDQAVGDLAVSMNYKLTDAVVFTFDGLNLNNPILKSYGFSKEMPLGQYVNGRQYYLGVRVQF